MTASTVRVWAMAWLTLLAAAGASRAGEVPRYGLKSGQVLTFEENQAFKGRNEDGHYRWTRRLWVVGRNAEGSWRVVVREGMKDVARGKTLAGDPHETVEYARFDVFPDGKVPPCPTLGSGVDPSHLFPRLPSDEKEASVGWTVSDDREGTTVRYEPLAGKTLDAGFDFVANQVSFMERIYEGKDRRTFHFDRKRGLVVRAEIERAYGAHMQGKGTGTLELTSIEELEPTKLAAFREEMDRYFDAQQAYRALFRKAETSGNEAGALLEKARTILADTRAKVTLPEPVAAIDQMVKNFDQSSKYQLEGAKRFAKVIGHSAPDWEVKDLDGRTHTLKQYRGKVLVLDFWYRGCGWCMRAMPQVKQIARHYAGRPVAVFGMNNDRKEDDARLVVREMQLDYPVLRSDDLPGKYGVSGFPTLVIIDQNSKVADVHVGYSPQLYEEVTAAVDRLLGAR